MTYSQIDTDADTDFDPGVTLKLVPFAFDPFEFPIPEFALSVD